MRSVRLPKDLLLLVPQSPLSEVPRASSTQWLEQRAAELLPVEYFHVVFTLPQRLAPLALQNQRLIYGILFRAAAETLTRIAGDPRHLGARIGFLAVLHTWGQNLNHHPHLHCVVPGGGIALDQRRWIWCRRQFLFPVKVLSRLFRAKFVAYLKTAFRDGKLGFHGELKSLSQRRNFVEWLSPVAGTEWVVYAKPPFGGPRQVLKYLARYTHRVAISNQRLISLENDRVTFRWKNYARGNQPATMTLKAVEFVRRFLLHVLPRGFVKVRHFGLLANRGRRRTSPYAANCWWRARRRGLHPAHDRLAIKWRPTSVIAVRAVEPGTCGAWKLCCRNPLRPPCSTPPSAWPPK